MSGSRKPYLAVGILLLLGGCATSSLSTTALASARPQPANLLLSDSPYVAMLGERFAGRDDWPTTVFGYVVEDVSTFTEFSYDDQSFFDRFGGGLQHEALSVRSGVVVR